MSITRWMRNIISWFSPRRRVIIVESDSLPKSMPRRNLVLAREGEEDWCVGMRCPCGCGHIIELLIIPEAHPRWDIYINQNGWPTLSPSVWLQRGCCSHFFVHDGKIKWCD